MPCRGERAPFGEGPALWVTGIPELPLDDDAYPEKWDPDERVVLASQDREWKTE